MMGPLCPSKVTSPATKRLRSSPHGAATVSAADSIFGGVLKTVAYSMHIKPDSLTLFFSGPVVSVIPHQDGLAVNVIVPPLPQGGQFETTDDARAKYISPLSACMLSVPSACMLSVRSSFAS